MSVTVYSNAKVERLLRKGWRIETATPTTVVLVKDKRKPNHVATSSAPC
jgi:hypothetical protein